MLKLEVVKTLEEELHQLIQLSAVREVTEVVEVSEEEGQILKEGEGRKRTIWGLEDLCLDI